LTFVLIAVKFADLFKIQSVVAGSSETDSQRRQSQQFCATYPTHTIRVQQPSSAVYFISRRLACARHFFKGAQNGYTIKPTSESNSFNYTKVKIIKNLNLHKRQKQKAITILAKYWRTG